MHAACSKTARKVKFRSSAIQNLALARNQARFNTIIITILVAVFCHHRLNHRYLLSSYAITFHHARSFSLTCIFTRHAHHNSNGALYSFQTLFPTRHA
eukprot:5816019-Amphidinium_carterae.1